MATTPEPAFPQSSRSGTRAKAAQRHALGNVTPKPGQSGSRGPLSDEARCLTAAVQRDLARHLPLGPGLVVPPEAQQVPQEDLPQPGAHLPLGGAAEIPERPLGVQEGILHEVGGPGLLLQERTDLVNTQAQQVT